MAVIEVVNLTRDYGNERGLFEVSLKVEAGQIYALLGPNGAGKSTLLRHLMGFLRPKQGTCRISGLDCWQDASTIQQKLGYLPGEINFFDDMTGLQYLDFLANYRRLQDKKMMYALMERFELNPKIKLKKMSKGMKQKVGIVAAFMHQPEILLLDEPTSGLDPLMQQRFIELIQEQKNKGTTILMASHIFEEVEKTADQVGILRKGRLITSETAEKLSQKHVRTYIVTLKTPQLASAFSHDFGGQIIKDDPCQVLLKHRANLEEIFLDYYEKRGAKQ